MEQEHIEISIINNPYSDADDSFAVHIVVNGEEKFLTELSVNQQLHIGSMLLKATKTFINNINLNGESGKS